MADLQGTNVLAPVVPFADTDTYPTHLDIYGNGGLVSFSDTVERNAQPVPRCKHGMFAYCRFEGMLYVLKDSWDGVSLTIDTDWALVARSLVLYEVYIDPAGSDSGAGTSASPFLTLQHAYETLKPVLNSASSLCIINVNNSAATYAGQNLVIDYEAAGYLKINGLAGVNDNQFSGSGYWIDCQSPSLVLHLDGVDCDSYLTAVKCFKGNLIWGSCTASDITSRVIWHDKANILFPSGSTPALAGDALAAVPVLIYGNDSTITAETSVVGLHFESGCVGHNNTVVFNGGGFAFTGISTGSDRCLQLYGGQLRLGGDFTFDNSAALSTNPCAELVGVQVILNQNPNVLGVITAFSATLDNASDGWWMSECKIIGSNVANTWAYGMSSNRLVMGHSTDVYTDDIMGVFGLGASATALVVQDDSDFGTPDMMYGQDFRQLQDLATSSFEAEITAILPTTPTVLVTGTANRIAFCNTVQVVNVTAGAVLVKIYHDDAGGAAANSNMIVEQSLPAESTLKLTDIPVGESGKIYIESDTNNGVVAKAWGYLRVETLADTPILLGQSSPGVTTPIALFNPANGYKTFIEKCYVANRNAGSQLFDVWCDQDGNTYTDANVVLNQETAFKQQLNLFQLGVWMNDNSGYFAWAAGVANDMTITVYGRKKWGA